MVVDAGDGEGRKAHEEETKADLDSGALLAYFPHSTPSNLAILLTASSERPGRQHTTGKKTHVRHLCLTQRLPSYLYFEL
jgi:hypothetical protein